MTNQNNEFIKKFDQDKPLSKIMNAQAAVELIQSHDTIATGGFVGIGFAEHLAIALKKRFQATQQPCHLTLIYAAGQGNGKEKGLNHLAQKNLVKKIIGGHWGLAPKLQAMALNNDVEAYNLPQGIISHLFRDIAAGKPGTISKIGIGTFVDPRVDGGALNEITNQPYPELIQINGEEYLFYPSLEINVALLRGTTADELGNVTFEKEALTLESLAIAMAAKRHQGKVIVQVERIAEKNSLNPRDVVIPSILVDAIVQSPLEDHWQTFAEPYSPSFSGELRVPASHIPTLEISPRRLIAARAAQELRPGQIINLGIGMPEGVAQIAHELNILDQLTLTAEPGVIGGVPAGGLNFGAAINTQAVIDQPYQFDFYDGGGLDIAFLGMAELDQHGNVNVSRFGSKLAGAGGFINISQSAKTVVFMGTFFTQKDSVRIQEGQVCVENIQLTSKLIKEVGHLTFSAKESVKRQQRIIYITDIAVFELINGKLILLEIASGVELEKDILNKISFPLNIHPNLKRFEL